MEDDAMRRRDALRIPLYGFSVLVAITVLVLGSLPSSGLAEPASPADRTAAMPRPRPTVIRPDPTNPLEVPAPAPTGTALPASPARGARQTLPLPTAAHSRGGLATGFPVRYLPAVTGSTVASSSVTSQKTVLQATLVATAPMAGADVIAFYQKKLQPLGFAGTVVAAAAGSTSMRFASATDSVTITATTSAKRSTTYSLFGIFRAASR
jgi:hypothetical protein